MIDTAEVEEMKAEMRDRRASGPPPAVLTTGWNPPGGRPGRLYWSRSSAWRQDGYVGPLDSRGCIPDPDDPAQRPAIVFALECYAVDLWAMEADDETAESEGEPEHGTQ